jgi:cytosine/adenosine deaminase-related metal-dependent hydrolase
MMRMGDGQLGHVREGYLADLLLIDGDPLADITVLQDKARILAVMKDGEFHRSRRCAPRARRAGPPERETPMANVLFTNVRILDGSGAMPTPAACSCRATDPAVGRSTARDPTAGATVIDGAGATLMPGMCEAHTHFSWNDAATLAAIQTMPLEEHVLWCAKVAKTVPRRPASRRASARRARSRASTS